MPIRVVLRVVDGEVRGDYEILASANSQAQRETLDYLVVDGDSIAFGYQNHMRPKGILLHSRAQGRRTDGCDAPARSEVRDAERPNDSSNAVPSPAGAAVSWAGILLSDPPRHGF